MLINQNVLKNIKIRYGSAHPTTGKVVPLYLKKIGRLLFCLKNV